MVPASTHPFETIFKKKTVLDSKVRMSRSNNNNYMPPSSDRMEQDDNEDGYDKAIVIAMLEACAAGQEDQVRRIIDTHGDLYASQQLEDAADAYDDNNNDFDADTTIETSNNSNTNSSTNTSLGANGESPLMMAAQAGHLPICTYLLDRGAPWNALNRQGDCAGNLATTAQHWEIVNALVDWGTRAELILGRLERLRRTQNETTTSDDQNNNTAGDTVGNNALGSPKLKEHESSTKPDYLRQRLQYSADNTTLLDSDQDAVMMEWERPLMQAHAQILMSTPSSVAAPSSGILADETATTTTTSISTPPAASQNGLGKRVLNVGFGLGIVDSALQEWHPSLHIIIEAHPDVYQRMMETNWHTKTNVRICFGTWQTVLPQLIAEGTVVDAIFFDTYGEHFMDMEDFHSIMVNILAKPGGIYSFFNGLAPDNLFFHGVACQCVKLQLSTLGLDSEFLPCEIQVDDSVWEGVRRQYWHGRDTYYLPVCQWNANFLQTGEANRWEDLLGDNASQIKRKVGDDTGTRTEPECTMDVEEAVHNETATTKRLHTTTTEMHS